MKPFTPAAKTLAAMGALLLLIGGGILWGRLAREQAASAHPDFEVKVSGHGRAVIFIPGIASPGSVWQPAVDALNGKYQCHVLTLAGFGGAKPTATSPFLPRVRDEIIAYIRDQKLDGPLLVGHSLGGVMALWVAETAPDLPGRLLIVDGLPYAACNRDPTITPATAHQRIMPLVGRYHNATPAQVLDIQRALLSKMVTSPEDAERLVRKTSKSDPLTIARALEEVITLDLRADLGRVRCPVRVLGALADKVAFPRQADAIDNIRTQYAALRGVRFTFFERSRHFIMIDDPAGFQQALAEELAEELAAAE